MPESLPTLATLLGRAGYRTAGFPTLSSLGLSSGLSQGFRTYGWSPLDLATPSVLAETDGAGWVDGGRRRQGRAAVADALAWVHRHKGENLFLWVHLSEASPPYASDKDLMDRLAGRPYDAALAYEDRCIQALRDGFASEGLETRTTFVVVGDHGESLGEHGETFHGLNLYPPSLRTAIAVVPPASAAGGAVGPELIRPEPGRLQDVFAGILALAHVALPAGSEARTDLPPVSSATPVLAVTAGPVSAFGWKGRVALYGGDTAWIGFDEEEVLSAELGGAHTPDPGKGRALADEARTRSASVARHLMGRSNAPPREVREKVLALVKGAAEARERRDGKAELVALQEAWRLDPGNYEVAPWLARSLGPKAIQENATLAREVESRSQGAPEGALAIAGIVGALSDPDAPLAALRKAHAASESGWPIELALRLSRSGKYDVAAQVLASVCEGTSDPDLLRTQGDLYLAVENTYRAGQAYDKASRIRPSDLDLLLRQGDSLLAVRDYKSAGAMYQAANALLPGLPVVELRLGNLSRIQGDRAAAVTHYRKSLGASTSDVAGSVALGRLLVDQGMTQEALPIFLDAAARDTKSPQALYFAAEALAGEGKLVEAETYLKQALERQPDNDTALYQLARLVVYRGDNPEGGRLLEKLAPVASTDILVAALRDPVFAKDPPGGPVAKGLKAVYEAVQRANPGGGAIIVPDASEKDPRSPAARP